MSKIQRWSLAWSAVLILLPAISSSAQTVSKQQLRGCVPEAVARYHLRSLGSPAAAKQLTLAIGLPLRDEQALDDLLREIYDPASPRFHQYLTPEQFTQRFGPTERDYQAVIDFAKANGLTVVGTHPNRLVLDVSGSVKEIERTFHVALHTYRHPSEARDFYAPDAEPSLDLPVPILSVSGLNNYSLPRPAFKARPAGQAGGMTPSAGSGPSGSYMGNDFRAAYAPDVSLKGNGQNVALVQFDGYDSNNIATYMTMAGLTNYPTVTNIPIVGTNSLPSGSANGEVCLDIEMVIAMAPSVSKIYVYEATNGTVSWSTMLSRIANDNLAKQVSSSWGGGGADPAAENVFKQMATQGQTYFNASGDYDAFTGSIPFPSDSTNCTQVGGTVLTTTGAGGAYVSETVWNDRTVNPNGGNWGSSGGISPTYTIPIWQQGINMTTNQGSTTMRNLPDVALTAKNVFIVADNNQQEVAEGTSCAAPLWAGYTALMNQQAANAGRPSAGFINPAIYAIGKGNVYNNCFHDTTTGDNTWSSSPTKFYATNGFDLCTGWGSPAGQSLIDAVVGPMDTLGVTPASGLNAAGPAGGPFSTNAQKYVLTNFGGTSLTWSLLGKPAWLDVSSSSGTLGAGGSATVTASLNMTAYLLLPGVYATNLVFTNGASGITQTRPLSLQVGQNLVQNGGFETGSFYPWTLIGTAGTYNFVDDGTVTLLTPNTGTYMAALGEATFLASLSQNLPTVPGQNYLLSFWWQNPSTGSPQQFQVNWNTNATSTNTLLNWVSPAVWSWTNMQFIVVATGTNTILQFRAENGPDWFVLDDVNVWPIPYPSFRSVVKTNGNNLVFSWNTLAGLSYVVQYSTNLATTNWVALTTNAAAGPVMTYTNAYGSDPRRFYRIRRLP
ncbi:MAG TPA: protease pro-enzyme activation domain-containing protein [Candidatus Acidoferrum sp.]|nr:protease pro-enzyme activation domain-containing protein [Candidatus Acidoferrum sp.]